MDQVVFESVRKIFRHRPALFNWLGRERSGETVALKDVSFSAAGSEVLVLLGPNGSGKTTALKLISTMLLPDAGSVRVGGYDARRDPGSVRRQVGIAVAAERSFFPRLSARENLEFFAALDEVPRRDRAQRIKEVLRIPDGGGLDAVLRCVNFMSWAAKCSYRIERKEDSALLTVTSCPPQEARVRSGKGIFACRPTFETGFRNVASVIDTTVKVSCRFCPPGPHPPDSWCQWEFRTGEADVEGDRRITWIGWQGRWPS